MSARKFGYNTWYAPRRSDRPSHMWISRFERVLERKDRRRGLNFDSIIIDEATDFEPAGILTKRGFGEQ